MTSTRQRSIKAPHRTQSQSRLRKGIALAVIAVPVVVALCLLGFDGSNASPTAASPTAPATSASPTAHTLARSTPTRLTIPALGINGGLQQLALSKDDKTIQLPAATRAGWYSQSSTPGQAGPTVIVGYIASQHGPGVFTHLRRLTPHATISLTRADKRTVDYSVDKIAHYAQGKMPAADVYAQTDASVLRIVTCGGKLEPKDAPGNVVVYAHELRVTR